MLFPIFKAIHFEKTKIGDKKMKYMQVSLSERLDFALERLESIKSKQSCQSLLLNIRKLGIESSREEGKNRLDRIQILAKKLSELREVAQALRIASKMVEQLCTNHYEESKDKKYKDMAIEMKKILEVEK
jgi:hypothetical protein